MCCFSLPVSSVTNTSIFARDTGQGGQILVYSMKLWAPEELAMVLPLPIHPNLGDDALHFIDLSSYPWIFAVLDRGFPSAPPFVGRSAGRAPLSVVQVGSFEASYVPTIADFNRLDPRFRLPASVWEELPGHASFGFAVFKLRAGAQTIHPMAFEFPRADPERLFFPTTHVHDGRVHDVASFDHTLYYQRRDGERVAGTSGWQESKQAAKWFMDAKKSMGVVDPERHVYRWTFGGMMKNQDIYV